MGQAKRVGDRRVAGLDRLADERALDLHAREQHDRIERLTDFVLDKAVEAAARIGQRGIERAPHRSLLRATGQVKDGEWDRPFVAVCNCPCRATICGRMR